MSDLAAWLPELGGIAPPLGVFAILGNHDRVHGRAAVADAIRRHTRWHCLRDEVAIVERDGARLAIAGLEDRIVPHESDGLPALAARVPAGTPTVLLVHHPNAFPAAARLGFPLTLAGHTHGGQVALPGVPSVNPARMLMTAFDRGTYVVDGAVLHVSCGIGTSGQRVRIGVPSEIAIVTLRVPTAGSAGR
jgi:predicted MPP superfamily phosphohydrolase